MSISKTPSAASTPSVVIRRATVGLKLTPAAQRVHNVLPQTQCQRCGEADCAHYAQAVADGSCAINRCQPGGQVGIAHIAQALGGVPIQQVPSTLDAECGAESPMHVAVIDEAWCIGCTLCIKVCPTDAIVGSNKCMHTVIESYCTGCDLCALACPVDCISMENISGNTTGWDAWSSAQAQQALQRYEAHQIRQQHDTQCQHTWRGVSNQAKKNAQTAITQSSPPKAQIATHTDAVVATTASAKKNAIQAALQRARAKRAGTKG